MIIRSIIFKIWFPPESPMEYMTTCSFLYAKVPDSKHQTSAAGWGTDVLPHGKHTILSVMRPSGKNIAEPVLFCFGFLPP
jgi:hypothetical protein